MRNTYFRKRVMKEIIRDPISLFFGLAFPLILLILLSRSRGWYPCDLLIFFISTRIAVFGLSFIARQCLRLRVVAKDRASSFLTRLFTTPMKSSNFILGYMLPLIVMSVYK